MLQTDFDTLKCIVATDSETLLSVDRVLGQILSFSSKEVNLSYTTKSPQLNA